MLSYEIENNADTTLIKLKGSIDENAFDLLTKIAGEGSLKPWIFDVRDVNSINSLGIRLWVNFMHRIQVDRPVTFTHCNPVFVMQMNMISSFIGSAKVDSFYGFFYCENCHADTSHLYDGKQSVEQLIQESQEQKCPHCSEVMVLEEDIDGYFEFLR